MTAQSARESPVPPEPKSSEQWVLPLEQLTERDLPVAGAKAVNLGRMQREGLPVPPGFVVGAAAFRQFAGSAPEWASLETELEDLPAGDVAGAEAWRRRALAALGRVPFPADAEAALGSRLGLYPDASLWAVRSSATVEDLPGASFAGQHDSCLNVSRERIAERVRDCWMSLFGSRAVQYRQQRGVPLRQAAMAVIVQRMARATQAGVLFTLNPVTWDPEHLVIESTAGLGEALVSGRVAPERVVVQRSSGAILTRTAGSAGGAFLDDRCVRALVDLGRQAERLFGGPLDLEWALEDGRFWLVQARPVTGKPRPKSWEDRQVWLNMNAGEVFPDVLSPVTWSLIQQLLPLLFRWGFRLLGAEAALCRAVGLVAGRIYFNANAALAALKAFAFLRAWIDNLPEALGGPQVQAHRRGLLNIPDSDLPDVGFRWSRFILNWPRILCDLIAHSPRRGDRWCANLKVRNDALLQTGFGTMPAPELARFFGKSMNESFEGWDLLYLVTQASALPVFQVACKRWLQDPHLTLGYRLFSGLGGMPEAEAGLALWRLAVQAHANPETEAALRQASDWAEALPRLRATAPGRRFLAAWDAFMAEHGHHCRGELELRNPRWSERPDYILGVVRGYLDSLAEADPIQRRARLAREREALTAQCRARLHPLKRWVFTRSLRRAQKLSVNREEWKNQAVRVIAYLRQILLRLGELLEQEGVLARADDVFFLEIPELAPVADRQAGFDVRETVAARRRDYDANLLLSPPPVVIGRFDPAHTPPPASAPGASVLTGIPVSPGQVTGRAKVILRADDRQQVLAGEILVAPITDPAWTPYFVAAAGVVTDLGGILSHGSIVAREYGLPAVTNVGCATHSIRTGDRIFVDGDRGRVEILERATAPGT